jgi:hypothetical protein
MKKTFFIFLLLLFPYDSFAQLDVYLSSQDLQYGMDVWTSENFPDSGSSEIKIENNFFREEFSSEYQKTSTEIKDLIYSLFPAKSS